MEKKTACSKIFFRCVFVFSPFSSFTDIPVMYETNDGYKGRQQGEINANSPAEKANKKVTFSKKIPPPYL